MHEFQPITSPANFQSALEYIAKLSGQLAQTCLGQTMPIDTVCLFTHSPEEYDFVQQAVLGQGPVSDFSHGPTTYVETDMAVGDQRITILGVRQPDSTRPQLGYGDYPTKDYRAILTGVTANPYLTEITSGRGQSLIELRHPDFDILGYIFDEAEH